jgi:hypothetical protein
MKPLLCRTKSPRLKNLTYSPFPLSWYSHFSKKHYFFRSFTALPSFLCVKSIFEDKAILNRRTNMKTLLFFQQKKVSSENWVNQRSKLPSSLFNKTPIFLHDLEADCSCLTLNTVFPSKDQPVNALLGKFAPYIVLVLRSIQIHSIRKV